ncbi:FG-GAP-like repeat-containing protein [Pontibacter locisalis]|uniref:FG-GAP-like repeat-containing protein n=1 Tax=Pontibacter locisalis TaxID=1719035 RepID=A0ABW5IGI0_9BACT
MKTLVLLSFLLFLPQVLLAQTITESADLLLGVRHSAAKWADFDGDGDVDLIISGGDSLDRPTTRLYENIRGRLVHKETSLPALDFAALDWGDFDGDGDLDLLVSGTTATMTDLEYFLTRIYRNDGGTFTHYEAGLPSLISGDVRWVDYDGDGDLDVYLSGIYAAAGTYEYAKIYRNDAGRFSDIKTKILNTHQGQGDWGDYDNDGDPDLVITGFHHNTYVLMLFRNDGGVFRQMEVPAFIPVVNSSAKWGDYDNDGDLDLVVTGGDQLPLMNRDRAKVRLYENQPCGFVRHQIDDLGGFGEVAWGDYDNDGDLDILASGDCAPCRDLVASVTRIYGNQEGEFISAGLGFVQLHNGSVAWADYDNDGDLDFVVTGVRRSDSSFLARLYINNLNSAAFESNTPPAPPSGLLAQVQEGAVTLTWEAGSDKETGTKALTYNVFVKDGAGNFLLSPMADTETGYRQVVLGGNVGQALKHELRLPKGYYYWGVQTVDGAFAGSRFTEGGAFEVAGAPLAENAAPPNIITPNGDGLNDRFVISTGTDAVSLKVYNRWGNLVFSAEEYRNGWSANGLPNGIYFYQVNKRDECSNETVSLRGWVEVIR